MFLNPDIVWLFRDYYLLGFVVVEQAIFGRSCAVLVILPDK